MNKVIQNAKWISIGLLLSLTCGMPAVADDTELLLINPNASTQTTPNVMLIIDSSGSMGNQESTREVYDSTQTYLGGATPCDPAYHYWTPYKSIVPVCGSHTQRVLKTAYFCEHSQKQLAGIGTYRSTLAQYRDGSSGFFSIFLGLSSFRWQTLEDANEVDPVECAKDRARHGDGIDTSALWAQKGGDVAMWTDQPADQVGWGSWPTSQSVTIYDGNYLNYLQNPVFVMNSRINIVQNTAKAVLNSIEGINVAVMRFNNADGGPVIQAMTDLDTNRAAIIATIDAIPSGGSTPVSETYYESALYWRGMPAYYGERINETATDTNALVSSGPEVYQAPALEVCSKNFNVVLTDGDPVNDEETPSLVDGLPNWFNTLGYAGCTFTVDGDCMDDIAEYLNKEDISPDPGVQNVITHTIGFAINLPILEETALRGGGDYFLADDVQSLTLALLEIVNDITDRSLSFAAPAIAVNTFNRTQNLNDLYLTTFAAREKYRWPGNLKKYRLTNGVVVDQNDTGAVNAATGLFFDSAHSFWSSTADGNDVNTGGAVENLPDPTNRNVYVNNTVDPDLTAGANAFTPSNAAGFSLADFALTGAMGEPSIDQLIRWGRGEDILDEDFDPTTTIRRQMGDPLHSQPAAVVYGGTPANPDIVVYTATNDGYVHAIDAATGVELWSFIPKEMLARFPSMFFNPDASFKNYGLDGDIVPITKDVDNDGQIEPADGDFVMIVFGMRRGGNAYFALDVTNKNLPKMKWRFSTPEMGQSWSTPAIARVNMPAGYGLNNDSAVLVIGGGYDTVHDTITHPASADGSGAVLYFVDLQSGNVLWRASSDPGAELTLATMTRSIPSRVTVADINGDSFADRMYASDTGGQLLRFDIYNGNAPDGVGVNALVTGGVVAQLGAEGNGMGIQDVDTRRFYTSPDVSIFNDTVQNRRFISISIGSGYRAHPLDETNADRFYSVRDRHVFNMLDQNQYDNFTIVKEGDLTEISGSVGTAIGTGSSGWKFTLPSDQKVLSTSTTFNNEIFFVAFAPDAAGAAACAAGTGRNFLYRVSVVNGDPIVPYGTTIVAGTEDALRSTDLAQGGIAPSPRFLFPTPDANCTGAQCDPPPIGCVGVECEPPGFDNNPVRTLWTQDGIE